VRWDIARHEITVAVPAVGMLLAADAAASIVGTSPFSALFASLVAIGLLYWEQRNIVRAAQARIAERMESERESPFL
jgi:hypothetical protein